MPRRHYSIVGESIHLMYVAGMQHWTSKGIRTKHSIWCLAVGDGNIA